MNISIIYINEHIEHRLWRMYSFTTDKMDFKKKTLLSVRY